MKKLTSIFFSIFDYALILILTVSFTAFIATWLILPINGVADKRVTIYSTTSVDIEKINTLLAASPVRTEKRVRVFVVPRIMLVLTNPIYGWSAQGFNILNFVFVNKNANLDTNRTLAGVIAHETTHSDVIEKFGFKTLFYKNWKIEGVCDYVSGESSVPDGAQVLAKYRAGQSLTSREKYFIYKTQVDTLLKTGYSVEDIITGDVAAPSL